MGNKQEGIIDREILKIALMNSFFRLHPMVQIQNPVMFIVYAGAFFVSFIYLMAFFGFKDSSSGFMLWVMVSLWLTVLIRNFAEALVEEIDKLEDKILRFNQKEDIIYKISMIKEEKCKEKKCYEELSKGTNRAYLEIKTVNNHDEIIKKTHDTKKEISTNGRILNVLLVTMTLLCIVSSFSFYFYFKFSAAQSGGNEKISITVLAALCSCLVPVVISSMLLPIRKIGMVKFYQEKILPIDDETFKEVSDIGALGTVLVNEENVSEESVKILKQYPRNGENIAILTGKNAKDNADSVWNKILKIKEIANKTRSATGILTLINILSNIVKCIVIFPSLVMMLYPEISALNIIKVSSPESAILSSLIYDILCISGLIFVLFKGFKQQNIRDKRLSLKTSLICGIGGIILPFAGLKLIDSLVSLLKIF